MKSLITVILIFAISQSFAQPMPHGMVYGVKPGTLAPIKAQNLEAFMGKRTRITVVILGKVIKVTQTKGGWFQIDAGNGKIIMAHFKNYASTIPKKLAGRQVLIDGVAQKQIIADDMQHLAGDKGKKDQGAAEADPKQLISFEVKGIEVQ